MREGGYRQEGVCGGGETLHPWLEQPRDRDLKLKMRKRNGHGLRFIIDYHNLGLISEV